MEKFWELCTLHSKFDNLKSCFTSNHHLPEEKERGDEPGISNVDTNVPELPCGGLVVQLEVGKVWILRVLGVLEDQGQIVVQVPDLNSHGLVSGNWNGTFAFQSQRFRV